MLSLPNEELTLANRDMEAAHVTIHKASGHVEGEAWTYRGVAVVPEAKGYALCHVGTGEAICWINSNLNVACFHAKTIAHFGDWSQPRLPADIVEVGKRVAAHARLYRVVDMPMAKKLLRA